MFPVLIVCVSCVNCLCLIVDHFSVSSTAENNFILYTFWYHKRAGAFPGFIKYSFKISL